MDQLNKKCSCGQGFYVERYLHNDWNGTLNCNVCDKIVKRYITLQESRDQQINKLLDDTKKRNTQTN